MEETDILVAYRLSGTREKALPTKPLSRYVMMKMQTMNIHTQTQI